MRSTHATMIYFLGDSSTALFRKDKIPLFSGFSANSQTILRRPPSTFGLHYCTQTKFGSKVIFSVAMCQEFCPGGVCLSACWDTTPPWYQAPLLNQTSPSSRGPRPHPGPGTPQRRHPFRTRHPPRTRHPSCTVHTGRYSQQAGSTHPTGLQSCLDIDFIAQLQNLPISEGYQSTQNI